jgi:hypothetical protein
MTTTNLVRMYDTYGHSQDLQVAYGSGFTVAASGTAAGTVVYPNTADPSGTASIVPPFGAADSNGLIQIKTSGTQTTGTLIVINFLTPYAYVPTGPAASISTTAGAAAGGTLTLTVTNTSLTIAVGTALTTGTTYNIRYTLAG